MESYRISKPLKEEIEFINLWENLPVLWNKQDKYYFKRLKRNEAYEKLLVIYKNIKPTATIVDVRKKINTLRTNYKREFNKMMTSQRSGDDVYIPQGWVFNYLRFLDKFENPQFYNWGIKVEEDYHEPDLEDPGTPECSTSISPINYIQPPVAKKIKSDLEMKSELLDKACEILVTTKTGGNSLSIANDWAETLDNLEPTQRLFAKKAINDVLFEAQLGNLDRNSVEINITKHAYPSSTN